MAFMLVRNTVRDYSTWRAVFDEPEELARASAGGLEVERVWQDQADPCTVWFLLRITDRANADAFLVDPASAAAGERAGAIDGEFFYIDDVT